MILLVTVLVGLAVLTRRKIEGFDQSNMQRFVRLKSSVYLDILKRTKRALSRLEIPMFLSSGTCLGYFREGNFIDYDYDVDVGIWETDYNPTIVDEMQREGLELYRVWGDKDSGMELSFRLASSPIKSWAKIDIFLHYRDSTSYGKPVVWWSSYAPGPDGKKLKYRVSEFSLGLANFLGEEFLVPYPTQKYIEEHYGKDWRVPKRPGVDYSYHSSPMSLVPTH